VTRSALLKTVSTEGNHHFATRAYIARHGGLMFVMRTCDSTAVVVWVVPDVARALKNTVIMKINITGLTACAGEVSSTIETR